MDVLIPRYTGDGRYGGSMGFFGSIPPEFEPKLRHHEQRFGKITTTALLDKDENLFCFCVAMTLEFS